MISLKIIIEDQSKVLKELSEIIMDIRVKKKREKSDITLKLDSLESNMNVLSKRMTNIVNTADHTNKNTTKNSFTNGTVIERPYSQPNIQVSRSKKNSQRVPTSFIDSRNNS